MKHYEYEINLFVDGELPKEQSREMFLHMAECTECRNIYSDFILLEKKSKEYFERKINGIIANQTPKISEREVTGVPIKSINEKGNNKSGNLFYKIAFYISAAAAVIFLFLFIGKQQEPVYPKRSEVRVDTVFVPKEKTIIKLVKDSGSSDTPGNKDLREKEKNRRYLQYVMNLRSEKVTDADLVQKSKGSDL